MTQVVKAGGDREEFDERKLYAAILIACREHGGAEDCHEVAGAVTDAIVAEIEDQDEVMSVELRMMGREHLREFDDDLAEAFYTHHGRG